MKYLIILLLLTTSNLFASSEFDKILALKDKPEAELELKFNDGFKQKIYGPIEIKEGPRLRCPCEVYDVSFKNEEGQKVTRRITTHMGRDTFDYAGADGKEYVVSTVSNKDEIDPNEKAPTCQMRGQMNKVRIVAEKAMRADGNSCPKNAVLSCMGDAIVKCEGVMECVNDPTYGTESYEIFCISKNSRTCPSMEECVADTAYEEFEKEMKDFGMEFKVTKPSTSEKK